MKTISPTALAQWLLDADTARVRPQLLDVREPWEYETCHLAGSIHVPMGEIPARVAEVDPDLPVVCICHHGARSAQVAFFLESQGVRDAFNLSGGLEAWALQVDHSFPRY